LTNARDRLRRLDPDRFIPRERAEYIIGLGEALYFDGAYGAAANVFDTVLHSPELMTGQAREQVLDWWATSLDATVAAPEMDRQRCISGCARVSRTNSRPSRQQRRVMQRRDGGARPERLQGAWMRRRRAGCAPRRRTKARHRAVSIGWCSA
jgi:hypothetical protein